MTLVWLIILALWAIIGGLNTIPLVAWLLLIPFALQDVFDTGNKQ